MERRGNNFDEVHPSKFQLEFYLLIVRQWDAPARCKPNEAQTIEMVVEDSKDPLDEAVSTVEGNTPAKKASPAMNSADAQLSQIEDEGQLSTNQFKRTCIKKQRFLLVEDNI
ncbi:hypothetical protein PIB30_076215 [Stylosanthes scabra]|uniref:Uncharacterized protein n=1 Tax=Stylosanthes scabra TaxID=79078 RepID=A0ABU6QPS8_9FABA|nr:hypothetical protein [Stylosanthes scabra]